MDSKDREGPQRMKTKTDDANKNREGQQRLRRQRHAWMDRQRQGLTTKTEVDTKRKRE
jgi:hypothetical protein